MAGPSHAASSRARTPRTVRGRAAEVIDAQRERMMRHLGSAVDGRDPEGVHDMRVASRRLRAALGVFEPWIERKDLGRVSPAVRSLTRALGAVRELDVTRLRFAELARRARPERQLAIEYVDGRVAQRRRRARARMMRRFAAVDLDDLDVNLQRLARELSAEAGRSDAGESTASGASPGVASGAEAAATTGTTSETADQSAATNDATPHHAAATPASDVPLNEDDPVRLLRAVAQQTVAHAEGIAAIDSLESHPIGSSAAGEALHQVRIHAKKLRYVLEIIGPFLGPPAEAAIDRLKALQDKLGDFHDDGVLDATLDEAIQRAVARGRPLLANELRKLRRARRRVLARDERSCRAEVAALHAEGFARSIADALGVPAHEVEGAAVDEGAADVRAADNASAGFPAGRAHGASDFGDASAAGAPSRSSTSAAAPGGALRARTAPSGGSS